MTTHSARIIGPMTYKESNGHSKSFPLGPCLIERLDDRSMDIIWGEQGQRSAAVPTEDVAEARERGHLILLD